jgi:hypothetical protein
MAKKPGRNMDVKTLMALGFFGVTVSPLRLSTHRP